MNADSERISVTDLILYVAKNLDVMNGLYFLKKFHLIVMFRRLCCV